MLRLCNCISYLYLLTVSIIWLLIRIAGDNWWPATLLMFCPRWIWLLPLFVLIPFAVWKNRRMILLLAAALLIVIGPIMGFTLSVSKGTSPSSVKPLRIVTCNLQNGKFDHIAFDAFIRDIQPEIVALQELPSSVTIKSLAGWQHMFEGDLHIFSRYQIVPGDYKKAFVPMHKWPRTCFLYSTVKTPAGDLTLCAVHLPSPRYGLQNILDKSTLISLKRKKLLIDETEYRRQKSQEIAAIVEHLPYSKVIAGDFNMPVESTIYRRFWSGYRNAFSERGTGYGWSERASVRRVPVWFRIDHVLMDKGMKPMICKTGPDVGSDHLPVIADIALQP